MKLYVLYHQNDESTREVEDFLKECENHTDKQVEKLDLETIEGASVASLYDTVSYPAILVVRDDGQLYKGWQGSSLPTVGEVISNLNN